MKRRDFLKQSALGAMGISAGFAAPRAAWGDAPYASSGDPVLVVIYLRGGQDQLNTIVPYNDSTYYGIRPTIAVPKELVVPLDNQFGLHPALGSLKPLYDEGKMAVIINSGSPHETRSHFDAQDFMEFAAPGNRTVRNGWLNRYLLATEQQEAMGSDISLRALAMQELLPRSMRGDYPVVAVPPNLAEVNEVLDLFEDFYGSGDQDRHADLLDRVARARQRAGMDGPVGIEVDPVMASGRETIQALRRLRQIIYGDRLAYGSSRATERDVGAFQEYPDSWFSSRLQMLAQVIKADVGLQVAATDINGWDHHIGMGSTDGTLNRMLEFVSAGLAAFTKDLGPELNRTTILLCTEFGRVCSENGNDGSDHGHGSAMWLMGGPVRGGKVYGQWTGLEPSALHDKRDLPVTTDFRQIFAEILTDHMRFELPEGFFPNYELPEDKLGLFAQA